MNVRHAAALALVGWYLIVPPSNPEGLKDPNATLVNGSAPLSQWPIQTSYDSSRECEAVRSTGMWSASHIARDTVKWQGMRENSPYAALDAVQKMTAQCISSDDPRLKGK